MRNLEKWYMRGLVALAGIIPGLLMTAGYFANIFFNAKGFVFWPMEFLAGIFWNMPQAYLWGAINILLLILLVGPLFRPRIFIWPALILNLFILVGHADLLWHNYERAVIFWGNIETGYGKYGWIMEQFAIIFFAALFLSLLIPAAWEMIRQSR